LTEEKAMQKKAVKDTVKAGYLRRNDAAKYLGVSLRTIGNLQSARRLPFSKIGEKSVLFKVADLDAFVARFRQNAIGEGF
jgi:excisionase family DNA binding protein